MERGDSLQSTLERSRLQHRSRRIELVLAVLRERAAGDAGSGEVPPPLRQAIAGFGEDLASVRRRLRMLEGRDLPARAVTRSAGRAATRSRT